MENLKAFVFTTLLLLRKFTVVSVCPHAWDSSNKEQIVRMKILYVIVFLQLVLTVCRFAMGGLFTTNVDVEHKTFCYHKIVCGARSPAYCKCARSEERRVGKE